MEAKNAYDWQKGADEKIIREEITELMQKNVSLDGNRADQPIILGFPIEKPDPLGVEIYEFVAKFQPNNIGLHTTKKPTEVGFEGSQELEKRAIGMVADLLGATLDDVDGYIESGGTIANTVGLWTGRNRTKTKEHNFANKTAVFASHLTHYSVPRSSHILGIGDSIQKDGTGFYSIGTDKTGRLLVNNLEKEINNVIAKYPDITNFVIVGNASTTMTGSVDDISAINNLVGTLKEKYPEKIFHFHIDAAFGGFIAPFIDKLPSIGFKENENLDTISLDAHKTGKTTYGSGIILARKGLMDFLHTKAPYVPGGATTFAGSRSGAMPASLYSVLRKFGKDGFRKNAENLMKLTYDIRKKLEEIPGIDLFESDTNIITVKGEFPKELDSKYIVHKHQMPVNMANPREVNAEKEIILQEIWNIVVMPQVREHYKKFIKDLKPYYEQKSQ